MDTAPSTSGKISRSRLGRYRSSYMAFNILNSLSFMLVSGNIPTLFALEMGASGTYIGLLGALNFVTFFFMPIGRGAIRERRIIGVFGWSWMLRYWGMIPALASPFLAMAGEPAWGLLLLMASSLVFNVFRGIGLIGNNPVLGFMAGDKDRGAFLSNVSITNSLTAIVTSAATVFALGRWSGYTMYETLLAAGVVTGSMASAILIRLPEPEAYKPAPGSSLFRTLKEAWGDRSLRRFVAVFAPLSFSAGTARTFIVTHARVLYAQSPGLVMLYSVAFNVGSVAAGYLSRLLMDRLGAKPLYAMFTAGAALALIPAALSPDFAQGVPLVVFLAILNFIVGFGVNGEENAGQTYFFSIVKPRHMVDLAVVYYIVYGLGGALGSAAGGVFLDAMDAAGASPALSYRVLYVVVLAITAICVLAATRLEASEAASIRESLGVLFSMRDLRAIGLLERLGKSGSPNDEVRLIRELGAYGASVAERELLPYLQSPRFEVRVEALRALENLDRLSPRAFKAIAREIERHPYTTAYVAARILGKRRYAEAVPLLRAALSADDYMLRGAAVIALAALGDEESLPAIEELVSTTDNPRLMINAASAIESFGKQSSVPVLVGVLKRENPPAFAFDEIVLAISGIVGVARDFYQLYSIYARDREEGLAALLDLPALTASRHLSGGGPDLEAFAAALSAFVREGRNGEPVARAIANGERLDAGAATVLAEAALDGDLAAHGGFRFFLAACAVDALPPNSP